MKTVFDQDGTAVPVLATVNIPLPLGDSALHITDFLDEFGDPCEPEKAVSCVGGIVEGPYAGNWINVQCMVVPAQRVIH